MQDDLAPADQPSEDPVHDEMPQAGQGLDTTPPDHQLAPPKKKHMPSLVFIVIMLVLVAGALVYFFVLPSFVGKKGLEDAAKTISDSQKKATKNASLTELASSATKVSNNAMVMITFPKGWEVAKTPANASVQADQAAAQGPITDDYYQPGIYVNVSPDASDLKTAVQNDKDMNTTKRLVSEKSTTVAGRAATRLEYKEANLLGAKIGDTPKNHIRTIDVIALSPDKTSVLIRFTVDEKQHQALDSLFDKVLGSVEVGT